MAERDPNEFSGKRFCGNCGAEIIPGVTACGECGSPVPAEQEAPELPGGYIPYCRACGVPVAREAALDCAGCGVAPLCREHYYPATRTCALCPPFELTQPGEDESGALSSTPGTPGTPNGPWAQPAPVVPCARCGARLRQGVQYCPDCGAAQEGMSEDTEYAGFFVRLGAAIIDSLVTGVPAAIITTFTDIPALGTILSVIYYVMFTYAKGQTPGKMLLGLHVVDRNGQKPSLRQVIMREVFGKAIAALALLIGYLWIIWDPKKRGWHDYIAGTFVVRRERN